MAESKTSPEQQKSTEDEPKEMPLQKGSEWGRNALQGIREMHQNEDARKVVAHRLF
jgi:hypothetical protein